MGVKEGWVRLILESKTKEDDGKQANKHKVKDNIDEIHLSQPMSKRKGK